MGGRERDENERKAVGGGGKLLFMKRLGLWVECWGAPDQVHGVRFKFPSARGFGDDFGEWVKSWQAL